MIHGAFANTEEAQAWLQESFSHAIEKYMVQSPVEVLPNGNSVMTITIRIDRRRIKRLIRKILENCE